MNDEKVLLLQNIYYKILSYSQRAKRLLYERTREKKSVLD